MPLTPTRVGFVFLSGSGLRTAAGAVDALLAVNAMLDDTLYAPMLLALPGAGPLPGTLPFSPLTAGSGLDALFVVASCLPEPAESVDGALRDALARIDAAGGLLGGIDAGAGWLAHAGLLGSGEGAVATTHLDAMQARHPGLVVSAGEPCVDRSRATCTGAAGGLDMMVAWLALRHGGAVGTALRQRFGLCSDAATGGEPGPSARLAPRLREALALMDANIGEPLSTQDIAQLVGVSRRQLERLFKQHLDALPSRHYLEKRLLHARRLLRESPNSILQVALMCGFSSGAHFSSAYRSHFARTPREERSARVLAWTRAGTPAPVAEADDDA